MNINQSNAAARENARQADGKFGTYALPKPTAGLGAAGQSASAYKTLERAADAAYDREDQAWFDAQSTEALQALWAQACDINRGAAWDDEVYEALAARGFFDDEVESHDDPALPRSLDEARALQMQVVSKTTRRNPTGSVVETIHHRGLTTEEMLAASNLASEETAACSGCCKQIPVALLGGTEKCADCVGVDVHNYRALHDGRMRRREYDYAPDET